jgi:hypothetical protein
MHVGVRAFVADLLVLVAVKPRLARCVDPAIAVIALIHERVRSHDGRAKGR